MSRNRKVGIGSRMILVCVGSVFCFSVSSKTSDFKSSDGIFFFCFILRFWNQILIWRSESPSIFAKDTRRGLQMYLKFKKKFYFHKNDILFTYATMNRELKDAYLLKWNSFSSSTICLLVNVIRGLLALLLSFLLSWDSASSLSCDFPEWKAAAE